MHHHGAAESAQQLRAWDALAKDPGSYLRTTWWLTTIHKPSSRGSNTLSLPIQACTHVV